ncbi:23S ribosomal RNA methyltransferase [Ascobolus immersus RN42]|uniref:rRNA methyltransferase 2, mitochondrial n=1 Tax=Ascobolus immersus RN42 TaxID=1160509 RepID=A0A3N4I0N6_ASCIM|nr:23S ribosomal RNA methyltransferase [Ascobolus immersus RN42]
MRPPNSLLALLHRPTTRLPIRLTLPSTTLRPLSTTPLLPAKSSSSSTRWLNRQTKDPYTKAAKSSEYKSRAAFKLVQINDSHKIFKRNQIVIDLGYAPGSWSQVAVDMTKPHGKVLGVDIIPVCPPKGVSTIQGNFLDAGVREEVREWIRRMVAMGKTKGRLDELEAAAKEAEGDETRFHVDPDSPGYIDMERRMSQAEEELRKTPETPTKGKKVKEVEEKEDLTKDIRHVDVILSDMMCNTSGIPFRDHAGSMDLCNAALRFALETLKPGGSFVCKFFSGAEDKFLQKRLSKVFEKVTIVKPDASRKESKEAFMVGKKRRAVIPDWFTLEAIGPKGA